jgi:RNase P/RNase MRP subunit p30
VAKKYKLEILPIEYMTDIVFPDKNEAEFIAAAEKLGIDSLCLTYLFTNTFKEKIALVENLKKTSKIQLFIGALCADKQALGARRMSDLVLVLGSENNRQVLEQGHADVLFELETQQHRDFIYQKNSGLNHILAELAVKKEVIIGLSFSMLINSEPKNRPRLFGRLMQNMRLCKKYKAKMAIASFARAPEEMRAMVDLRSLFACLGLEQSMAKQALSGISLRIMENKEKKSPDYIGKGIKILK